MYLQAMFNPNFLNLSYSDDGGRLRNIFDGQKTEISMRNLSGKKTKARLLLCQTVLWGTLVDCGTKPSFRGWNSAEEAYIENNVGIKNAFIDAINENKEYKKYINLCKTDLVGGYVRRYKDINSDYIETHIVISMTKLDPNNIKRLEICRKHISRDFFKDQLKTIIEHELFHLIDPNVSTNPKGVDYYASRPERWTWANDLARESLTIYSLMPEEDRSWYLDAIKKENFGIIYQNSAMLVNRNFLSDELKEGLKAIIMSNAERFRSIKDDKEWEQAFRKLYSEDVNQIIKSSPIGNTESFRYYLKTIKKLFEDNSII